LAHYRRLTVLLVAILAGCNGVVSRLPPIALAPDFEARAKAAIAEKLRDPESARFIKMQAGRHENGNVQICGLYNAKNGFGGYDGYQPFAVRLRPTGELVSVMSGLDGGGLLIQMKCQSHGMQL